MRIFSKFHDYYDGALGHGFDPSCVYDRKTEEAAFRRDAKNAVANLFAAIEPDIPHANHRTEVNMGFSLIVFCGKTYPCLNVGVGGDYERDKNGIFEYVPAKTVRHYDAESVSETLSKVMDESAYAEWNRKKPAMNKAWRFRQNADAASVAELFRKWSGKSSDEAMKLHVEERIPCFLIGPSANSSEIKFERNPRLADFDFYKVFDAYAAFQEISMFIGGILGGRSPEMIEISDSVRIAKHGFDERSFRKAPEKSR
jgi:hypothetical protein